MVRWLAPYPSFEPRWTTLGVKLGLGLEEVFVFDSKSENRDRAVDAVVRIRVRVRKF